MIDGPFVALRLEDLDLGCVWQRRTLKRDFKEPREGGWRKGKESWTDIVKENERFEEYYKAQGVVPDDEWDEFLTALRRPLPVTFRINGRGRFAEALRKTIELKWAQAKVVLV